MRRFLPRFFCAFLCALIFAPQTAPAQSVSAPLNRTPAQNSPPSRALSKYDEKLGRMAEILGALHYLCNLCAPQPAGAKTPAEMKWRDYMQKLIEALRSEPKQTARLYAAFNRSYQALAGGYGSCTQAAREALGRYWLEGRDLSHILLENYGSDFYP